MQEFLGGKTYFQSGVDIVDKVVQSFSGAF